MGRPLPQQGGVGTLTVLIHWLFAITFLALMATTFGMALGMIPSSFLGGDNITTPGVAITMLVATFVLLGWIWFAESVRDRRTVTHNPSLSDIRRAVAETPEA